MTSTVAFGDGNRGNQVGVNNGSIYLQPARPETPPPPQTIVPFRRDPHFVDRGSLMDQMHEQASTPGSRIALVGLGGVGKSQLAIEFCYQVRDLAPEKWILWIHASNGTRFEQSCRTIAGRMKIPGHHDPQRNAFELLYGWLGDPKSGEWVLVLDNIDDDEFLYTSLPGKEETPVSSIWAYLRQLTKGLIVITSRSRVVASRIAEDYDVLSIEPMDGVQATSLFVKKVGEASDMEIAPKLVEALDYMPLAIVQAASFIKKRAPRQTIKRYLEDFLASDQTKIDLLNHEGGNLRRDLEANYSIIITWQISFDYIWEKQNSAANLLSLMSFFDRQEIPEFLVRDFEKTGLQEGSFTYTRGKDFSIDGSGTNLHNGVNYTGPIFDFTWLDFENDPDGCDTGDTGSDTENFDSKVHWENTETFEDDIIVLRDFSMISIGPSGRDFEMHRLVQLSMRDWLLRNRQLLTWQKVFFQKLRLSFLKYIDANWQECRQIWNHFQRESLEEPNHTTLLHLWTSLLYGMSLFAFSGGRYLDAKEIAEKARSARIKRFGLEHRLTLAISELLAAIYLKTSEVEKAIDMQRTCVQIRERLNGPLDHTTLQGIQTLATMYGHDTIRQYEEAKALQSKVVQIYTHDMRDAMGSHQYVHAMDRLADICESQGQWLEAEGIREKIIEMLHEYDLGILGTETSKKLLVIYRKQCRWKEAEALLVKLIESNQTIYGQMSPETLASMEDLVQTYTEQDRFKDAEELQLRVVEGQTRGLGSNHTKTLSSIFLLARTYENLSKWEEATELMSKVYRVRESILGTDHHFTLVAMSALTDIYYKRKMFKEAEDIQLQVLVGSKRVYGMGHRLALLSMKKLAFILLLSQQSEAGLSMMEECTRIFQHHLGPEHPETLRIVDQNRFWRQEFSL